MASNALTSSPPSLISLTTVLSLFSTLAVLGLAYGLLRLALPTRGTHAAPLKTQLIFLWHAFDFLIHFTLEASFLYHCFFTSTSYPLASPLTTPKGLWTNVKATVAGSIADAASYAGFAPGAARPMTPQGVWFLGNVNRLYGSFYGTGPMAKLWQEYAKADRRWGGSDLGIISLELLTVFVMAPLSVAVCWYLREAAVGSAKDKAAANAKAWILMVIVATGELYGGFMTFAPEWLSGNSNLNTSNWMYLWLYLFFFNFLWVAIPAWVLYEAWGVIGAAFEGGEKAVKGKKGK